MTWKLVLGMTVVMGLVAVFLLVYFPAQMGRQAKAAFESRARGFLTVLADAVSPGVAFFDEGSVAERFANLKETADVVYAVALSADGSPVASWGDSESMPTKLEFDSESLDIRFVYEKRHLHVIGPIRSKGQAVGTLRVGFSLASLDQAAKENTRVVLIAVALIFGFGLAVSIMFGRWLVGPIRLLTEATRRVIDEGDLTQKIETTSEDEVGQLAASFNELVVKLREIPLELAQTVEELNESLGSLAAVAEEQNATMEHQASSLAEVSATTGQIEQTASITDEKVKDVLAITEHAEKLGASGQQAVEESLAGVEDIGSQIEAIVERITELARRTAQIGEVTETVKDLADQSNILALNAAIEAAKAGEAGRGFAVVAREIRSLADQSIQSTIRIREILSETNQAIEATVKITEQGSQRMERSIDQIRVSGQSLGEMAASVTQSSSAARQIAASMRQQGAGIRQINDAVQGLTGSMDQALVGVRRTEESVEALRSTARRVTAIVESFRI